MSMLWGEPKSHVCKANPTRVRARSSLRRDGSRASALTSASVTLVHQPRCTVSNCLMPACTDESQVRPSLLPCSSVVAQCMLEGQPDTAICRREQLQREGMTGRTGLCRRASPELHCRLLAVQHGDKCVLTRTDVCGCHLGCPEPA